MRVFKIHKEKKEGINSAMSISHEFDFPKVHKADIISVGISSTGKYIMSADSETQIIIWSVKGKHQMLYFKSFLDLKPNVLHTFVKGTNCIIIYCLE